MTTKRRDEVLVGLLLLVSLTLGLGGTIWIARGGLSSGYPMYARFNWGAGLKQGQPVLLAGVQVGYVDGVELIPDGTIGVRLRVQKEFRIPTGSTASVQANGIFGDQLIAVTPVLAATTFMAEGDTIPVGKGSPGVPELLTKGDSIARNVQALTLETRTQFVDSGGIREVRKTIADLTSLVAQLSTVASEQSKQLTLTQEQLRSTLASVDSTRVDATLKSVQATAVNVEQLTRELQTTNAQVRSLVDKASSGPGTVGKLMNDPSVYARVDTLLLRVDSLVADLKKNPKKYINLRVF